MYLRSCKSRLISWGKFARLENKVKSTVEQLYDELRAKLKKGLETLSTNIGKMVNQMLVYMGKATTRKKLHDRIDVDALSDLIKSLTKLIWPNSFQSKEV